MAELLPRPGWEKPLNIKMEGGVSSGLQQKGLPAVTTYVQDAETYHRLREGYGCIQCGLSLPDRPCRQHLKMYERVGLERWGAEPHVARTRIVNNCCPACGMEITPQVFAAMFTEVPAYERHIDDPHEWLEAEKHKLDG
jgi:hypothetical protein